MALDLYWQKRNFETTPEPRGRVGRQKKAELGFVIQKHRASHLHYDFRLELDGVLLSWAVPKGPSLDPSIKRLAMHVEDHPIEYGDFEGVIPPKQYGSGTVMLWDRGAWIPEGDDPRADYKRGRLKFRLEGEKLQGSWALVRTWDKDGDGRRWLLLKHDDEFAAPEAKRNITVEADYSVVSGRNLDQIAAEADAVWDSHKSVAANVKAGAVERGAHRGVGAKRSARARRGTAVGGVFGPDALARKASGPKAPPTGDPIDPARLEGARKAKIPEEIGAQLCTLVRQVPGSDEWLHEIKYDGYRMLAKLERGRVTIISRNGKEWTGQLGPVSDALAALDVKSAWIDGEVVVLLPDGRTSFQELQLALGASPESLKYYAFDLMYLDGYDLRAVPLIERKRALRAILPDASPILAYSDHFTGDGQEFFELGCRRQLEGVVSKKRDATYQSTRGGSWVKTKCSLRQELVIGGWTEPSGSRTAFGALLLGAYEGRKLRYVGKVGTGFDTKTLVDIHKRLRALAQTEPPFENPPRGADARGAHWVKPQLVGEIEFTEWTKDGTARHPSFKGLRLDKKASQVVIEKPVPLAAVEEIPTKRNAPSRSTGSVGGAEAPTAQRSDRSQERRGSRPSHSDSAPAPQAIDRTAPPKGSRFARPKARRALKGADDAPRVTISNPDKILYPEAKITKLEVAEYYRAIGDWMLPYLEGRPLTLVRCPNGYKGQCFYQKHVKPGTSELLTRVKVPEGKGYATYMSADSVEAIVALLQMGVLEIHPWGSRTPHLGKPDVVIFDFDPDEGLGYREVVEAATLMRQALEQIDLRCFLKTTGGKGLHVVVPLQPSLPWDEVKAFTKAIADSFAAGFPDKFTAKLAKASRGRKIFIDYLRNAEGATAIGPYSVRAKKNASVATPIHWEELKDDVRFDRFNLRNVPERLARMKKDPWADFFKVRQKLTKSMLKSVGL